MSIRPTLLRLGVLGLALSTLAGCYVAPAPPPAYGYAPRYYAPAPYYRPYGYGGWGYRHW